MLTRLILLTALLLASACAHQLPDTGDDETGQFLTRLLGKSSAPYRLQPDLQTLPLGGRSVRIAHYPAVNSPRGVLILVPGLNRQGLADRRLTHTARVLASHGFSVHALGLSEPEQLYLSPDNINDVYHASLHILDSAPPGMPAGLAAISFGSGPALIAAMEPALEARLDFILTIGGYFDLHALLEAYSDANSAVRHNLIWTLALTGSALIDDARDRAEIETVARSRLKTLRPLFPAQAQVHSADAHALVALLENRDPGQTGSLLQNLPQPLLAHLQQLDPSRYSLKSLTTAVYLIHGAQDTVIPAMQSVELNRILPNSRLHVIGGLEHVDLNVRHEDIDDLRSIASAVLNERLPADTTGY